MVNAASRQQTSIASEGERCHRPFKACEGIVQTLRVPWIAEIPESDMKVEVPDCQKTSVRGEGHCLDAAGVRQRPNATRVNAISNVPQDDIGVTRNRQSVPVGSKFHRD